jgi:hypothetical protein
MTEPTDRPNLRATPRRSRRISAPLLSALLLCATILPATNAQTPPPAAPQDESVPQNIKDAVVRALAYCKSQQKPDGSFNGNQGDIGETAVPSLVVMAYLAHGDVPGQGPYGEVVNKAIDYVLDSQRPDGIFARQLVGNVMYEHGISTVMLSEAYGMVDDTRRARIDAALAKSVALILAAQKVQKQQPAYEGGWRYTPQSPDSDISCTGWQLMALRGAAECGAAVPPSAIKAGLDYVRSSAFPTGGFSYQPGRPPDEAITGTGILAMELLGDHNSTQAIAAGNFLLDHPPDRPNIPFYYYAVYYCAQATNQLGGRYWQEIYPKLVSGLLAQQQPDGSFGHGMAQEEQAGPCYRSAMACLALCVPFRYLPLYQK